MNPPNQRKASVAPMLDLFQSIGGAVLRRVTYFRADGCVATVALDFGPKSLVVVADDDDDTVAMSVGNTDATDINLASDVSTLSPWAHLIGKPFGWGYVVINQQGYCDGLLLGFGDVRPSVLLQVIASSIHVSAISDGGPPGKADAGVNSD